MIPLVSGEIAEDITAYYAESEQIPTLLALGVLVDTNCTCLTAGGVMVQLLPFADEAVVSTIEKNAASLGNISGLLRNGKSLKEIADIALDGIEYDVFDELDVAYRCTCSRERIAGALHSIGQKELDDMLALQEAEGKARELEVLCQFCDNRYIFTEKEIAAFFKKT